MPRISPALVRHAKQTDIRLAKLLPICRSLDSARNELRWLKQHASSIQSDNAPADVLVNRLIARRAKGEPLQYILGSEYFGDLRLECRPGVLIPRPETAASISHLVDLLFQSHTFRSLPRKLQVLDLCTGSGCLPLLFHHEYFKHNLRADTDIRLIGIDISKRALKLARDNLSTQLIAQKAPSSLRSLQKTRFLRADVLHDANIPHQFGIPSVLDALRTLEGTPTPPCFDILISNPPYISSRAFLNTTARSVKLYEPKLALVPQHPAPTCPVNDGDTFYPRILDVARKLDAKVVLVEVGDMEQAVRVASLAIEQGLWDAVEIWRDEPGRQAPAEESVKIGDVCVFVRGVGYGRSVFAYRGSATEWFASEKRVVSV
ncbi:hypothetical protein BAUCODRAFT_122220 [Baudoinia panamericana UAMH 10762]|uniref:S-adenosyl-L-methionine-dependent methyltransferase n=1 Tax=Baudoinia panamericana (strain UAMH 10762) TaxID=717646 RepID=M2MXA5_BAUPA|nr:uncharacterized protein BAUCODRAFT_122220 [Baudoinia panamericana UAMH 10762]EMC96188.1 hypothetical protein BAUCODRAFT_122220 [Baudoinia panamericana UAMH 10762]